MQHHTIQLGLAVCTPIPMVPGRQGRPVLDTVSVKWHRHRTTLQTPTNWNMIEIYLDGLEVGEARQIAAERVLAHTPRPKYLFFLDYDVLPDHTALSTLIYRAEQRPDVDIFAGVYCLKNDHLPEPLIYVNNGTGPYWDWTLGDVLENITAVHMGLTLIRTSLFERIENTPEKPWFLSPRSSEIKNGFLKSTRGTEDIYFCDRAIREAGAKILVDTSVLAAHEDKHTGKSYGLPTNSPPVLRARWRQRPEELDPDALDPPLRAIDLGAGGTRRQWPGYVTETLDIRKIDDVDYVQDLTRINIPDEVYDLTASSHTLEHLGRFDQEKVWGEIFRLTRPGGKTEHIVPNVEWAAHKIADGEVDVHVMNVLYGAQESHNYERIYNTHFFGYTPAIGKALAEAAGFVDVTTETWRESPELGYNLIIRGTKPGTTDRPPTFAEMAEAATRGRDAFRELVSVSRWAQLTPLAKKRLETLLVDAMVFDDAVAAPDAGGGLPPASASDPIGSADEDGGTDGLVAIVDEDEGGGARIEGISRGDGGTSPRPPDQVISVDASTREGGRREWEPR